MTDNLRSIFIAWWNQKYPGTRPLNSDFDVWISGYEHGAQQTPRPDFMNPPGARRID